MLTVVSLEHSSRYFVTGDERIKVAIHDAYGSITKKCHRAISLSSFSTSVVIEHALV
jgi:hypothetical protein